MMHQDTWGQSGYPGGVIVHFDWTEFNENGHVIYEPDDDPPAWWMIGELLEGFKNVKGREDVPLPKNWEPTS